jgi:hypothetical protein
MIPVSALSQSVERATEFSSRWLEHFRTNRDRLLPIPWEDPYELTATETKLISHSIQTFQLGESSEGTHLMQLSRDYAEQTGDRHWVETIKLFIGEEQRHARDLARFMTPQQIPLAQQQWTDTWFRKLRRLANLEVALMVLFTAELIATLYYPALGQATRSPILSALCRQIVYDETQHVRFQTEALRSIRYNHPRWRLVVTDGLYALFFRVTAIAVWLDHYPVLKAGGYSAFSFYQAACHALKAKL